MILNDELTSPPVASLLAPTGTIEPLPSATDHSQKSTNGHEAQSLGVLHGTLVAGAFDEHDVEPDDPRAKDRPDQWIGDPQFRMSTDTTLPPVVSVDDIESTRSERETTQQRVARREAAQAAYQFPKSLSMLRKMEFSARAWGEM